MASHPSVLLFFTFAIISACGDKEDTAGLYEGDEPGECSDGADNDRDGLYDCDDPGCAGAPVCQEVDTDTDADADTDTDADTDADADGDTDTDTGVEGDQDGDGFISEEAGGDDCDDTNASIHPGAEDTWGDGVDQDCDGLADASYMTNAAASLWGEAGNDHAGSEVSGAGDVNGDGYDDILVTAYMESTASKYSGAVYLVHGPVSGEMSLADANAKLMGTRERAVAGYALAPLGDVDADGFDDILVGARADVSGIEDAPIAYLIHGPVSGEQSLGDYSDVVYGAEASCAFMGLSSAGDWNEDGHTDLLVGTACESAVDDLAGAVYVLQGPLSGSTSTADQTSKVTGENEGDYAGYDVSGNSDVDGDGFNDILIGALFEETGGREAGAAYLVSGPVTSIMDIADAEAKLTGHEGDWAGYSVAMAGDLNADGYDDIIVGALQGEGMLGAAYISYGPVAGEHELSDSAAVVAGVDALDMVGASVSSAGDMNVDGYDDVVVGAYGSGEGGEAVLVYGPVTGHQDLGTVGARLVGSSGEYAGWDVAGAGDTNSDGLPDVIVGADSHRGVDHQAGAAYLFLGT